MNLCIKKIKKLIKFNSGNNSDFTIFYMHDNNYTGMLFCICTGTDLLRILLFGVVEHFPSGTHCRQTGLHCRHYNCFHSHHSLHIPGVVEGGQIQNIHHIHHSHPHHHKMDNCSKLEEIPFLIRTVLQTMHVKCWTTNYPLFVLI